MYCPYCSTALPEKPANEARCTYDTDAHIPVQSLSCPGCEAAILLDDRREVIPIDAPIITILIVYK